MNSVPESCQGMFVAEEMIYASTLSQRQPSALLRPTLHRIYLLLLVSLCIYKKLSFSYVNKITSLPALIIAYITCQVKTFLDKITIKI